MSDVLARTRKLLDDGALTIESPGNDGLMLVVGNAEARALVLLANCRDELLAVAEAAQKVRDYAQLEDDAHLLDALPDMEAAVARLEAALGRELDREETP